MATAVVVLLGILPIALAASPPADPVQSDGALAAAIERATREAKPIVLFSRPANCRASRFEGDPCGAFEAAVQHPAIQRRLERAVYVKVETAEKRASVSVLDPGGRPVVRWAFPSDVSELRQMFTLVDGAAPFILNAFRARMAGDSDGAAREECLATLALGDESQGRAGLLALRDSGDQETRELATIWLGWFETRLKGVELDELALATLAKDGATKRVRFEAWMAIGEARLAKGKAADATAAFRSALDEAPETGREREAAHAAIARSTEAAPAVIGLGPPGSIVAGLRTIQPKWNEPRASRVEYRLDGQLVATARKSPFAAAVKFDRLPTRKLLELSAMDKQGKPLRSASVVVNDRSGAFALQIVEPAGEALSGRSDVELAATVPRGRSVDEIVVEWNGVVVARLQAPPWKTSVEADGASLGVLRAIVRLDDGQEREDVRLFNTGEMLLTTGVHLVEVPVYGANRNLRTGEVVVKEAGVPRQVDRVIPASEASLDVALLLDMSTSMKGHVLDLEEAALQFVDTGLEERARVTVVAFDTTARVALWPTSDRAPIERAIQSLRVRGATALHDAIITSILQLQAGGSRRAIVVLSDGLDNSSIFSMRDVLEVARRNAVPIYAVNLNRLFSSPPTGKQMPDISSEVKAQDALARLARSSGGMAFELRAVDRAGSIWQKIADDLRNQSLVIYKTSGENGGWRKLDVSLKQGGSLRAPEGVFIDAGGAAEERQ